MISVATFLRDHCRRILGLAVLVVIAALYWSVHDGGFVGVVDREYFHDFAWLRSGTGWHDILFRNAYNWSNYYRPLGVAMFVIEERAFDVAPGPMHVVSLAVHLMIMLLIGAVGARLLGPVATQRQRCLLPGLAMLAYGLHPALVEPVVSVACQFDLFAMFFVLLGLWVHTSTASRALRGPGVGICFLLGASFKESAVVLPLLALIIDWTRSRNNASTSFWAAFRCIARDQWCSYLGMFAAGLVYLGMREYALGYLLQAGSGTSQGFTFARFQMACWIYVSYWRILVWPMAGLGPIHEGDISQFLRVTPQSIGVDVAALAILLFSAVSLWRGRGFPGAGIPAAVTVALLPVLRIVPIDFDSSLLHERYALSAIAAGCLLLPSLAEQAANVFASMRVVAATIALLAVGWLAAAALNVAVTIPLWQDEVKLWQSVVMRQPQSLLAKNFLLSAHLSQGDLSSANKLADAMASQGAKCPVCLLNVASLAISSGDRERARDALNRTAPLLPRLKQARMFASFEYMFGQLRELDGDRQAAEAAYRRSLEFEPLDPQVHMHLAMLLARTGRRSEAREEASRAEKLLAPDERDGPMREFRSVLAEPTAR